VAASYYDGLLPVRDPGPGLPGVLDGLRPPYRVTAAIRVPAGEIVVAFVSDSAELSRMFAANWAPAAAGDQPDATLCALTGPTSGYGLDGRWDGARWWSPRDKIMLAFGFGAYRLVKVCVRGICSAVSGDDTVFVHGCTLTLGAGPSRRGVVITGTSGAGKTTLVAGLLQHREHDVAVLGDDWGAVSLRSGQAASTGERMLHMKTGSVLALRPGFFSAAPDGTYARDQSDPDRSARMLVSPRSVYGASWQTAAAAIDHVAVVVREPPGWRPPGTDDEAVQALEDQGGASLIHHHEMFLNGSLILTTENDRMREEQRYRRLLGRTTVSWINNCGTPQELTRDFIATVMDRNSA
jgi:CobW/HypB/UreG, nucleotide-binding domain